jgi:hypothetical protein
MLSTEQKAIIRRIAKEQNESFIRIIEQKLYDRIVSELEEEGYDVSELDILEHFSTTMEMWDQLLENPEEFFKRLDDINLSILKHILINEFELTPETRGIWRKLNLWDKVKKIEN